MHPPGLCCYASRFVAGRSFLLLLPGKFGQLLQQDVARHVHQMFQRNLQFFSQFDGCLRRYVQRLHDGSYASLVPPVLPRLRAIPGGLPGFLPVVAFLLVGLVLASVAVFAVAVPMPGFARPAGLLSLFLTGLRRGVLFLPVVLPDNLALAAPVSLCGPIGLVAFIPAGCNLRMIIGVVAVVPPVILPPDGLMGAAPGMAPAGPGGPVVPARARPLPRLAIGCMLPVGRLALRHLSHLLPDLIL